VNILKRALLGSLRIAFFGALKVALCVYILFLPDATFAGSEQQRGGQMGETASGATP
jgi:hypothetical protein